MFARTVSPRSPPDTTCGRSCAATCRVVIPDSSGDRSAASRDARRAPVAAARWPVQGRADAHDDVKPTTLTTG